MKNLLQLLLIIASMPLFAQPTTSLNTFGGGGQDNLRSAYMDSEGNMYVLAGSNGGTLTINGVQYATGMGTGSFSYLVKLDQSRNYVWHVVMNYTISIIYSEQRIAVDNSGNVYITDFHWGSGSVGGQSVPIFTNNIGYFTAKFDSNGVQQWVLPSGGERIEMIDENTIAIYSYRNQSDFIGSEQITNESGTAYFIDSGGNYINHFQIDDSNYAYERILGRENSGLYYGMRKNVTLGISSNFEMFKCDADGLITESKLINVIDSNDTPSSVAYDRTIDAYFIAGKFRMRNPFDAPTGTYLSTSMLLHLDNQFNLVSSLQLGPELSVSGAMPAITLQAHEGNLYLAGTMAVATVTVWRSFGQNHYLFPVDDKMVYAKFTSDLQLQWYREIPELSYTNSILPAVGPTGISIVGRTSDMIYDGFTHDASGGDDIFVLNTEDNNPTIELQTGMIFIDTDQNGVFDEENQPAPYFAVTNDAIPGITQYSGTNGIFSIGIMEGEQSITRGYIPTYWTATTPDSYIVTGNLLDDNTDTIQFGITPIPGLQDLSVTINPNSACRMNTPIYHVLEVCNFGTTIEEGNAILFLDSLQNLVNIVPSYTVSGDSILLPYSNLAPGNCSTFYIETLIEINVELLGEDIHLLAVVEPIAQDTTPLNNFEHLYQEIIGSYDPNDITVLPSCDIAQSFITDQKDLDYLIRFQNTGNDTAFNITITCPVSPYLDPSSISFSSSSHNPIFYVTDDLLTIEFQNILLPDSFVNEQASHGYFRFSVKPLSTMVPGNNIEAVASIFFDFNPPVITNTVTTTLQNGSDLVHFQTLPSSCSGEPDGVLIIDAPCLGNQFEIQLDGGEIMTTTSGVLETLSGGMHDIIISYENSIIYEGTIDIPEESTPIQFEISPATCSEFQTGSIEISGGCLPSPYLVSINGSDFFEIEGGMISNLEAGLYEIRISGDGDTTTHMAEVTAIVDGNGINFDSSPAACPNSNDGQIMIESICFDSPIYYTLDQNSPILLENGVISNVSSGLHHIEILHSDETIYINNFEIGTLNNPSAEIANIQATCLFQNDGIVSFNVNCANPPYWISTDDGEFIMSNEATVSGLSVGQHNFKIAAGADTIYMNDIVITAPDPSLNTDYVLSQPVCPSQPGQIMFNNSCLDSEEPITIIIDGQSIQIQQNEPIEVMPGTHHFVMSAFDVQLFNENLIIYEAEGPQTEMNSVDNTIFLTFPELGNTYQWYECENSVLIDGANSESYAPESSGLYYVAITTPENCIVLSECLNFVLIDVSSTVSEDIKIFPNPNQGQYMIQLPDGSGEWSLTIYDAAGRILQQQKMNTTTTSGQLEHPGIYHFQFSNTSKIIHVSVVVD
jgi:hypothetical protein